MVWKCLCDCGNISYATTHGLKIGDNQSCGCLKKELEKQWVDLSKLNLTGQKFGKLTVLKPTERRTKQQTQIWEC